MKQTKEPFHVVTFRLPAGLIKELDRIVEEEGHSSRSQLVRQLLRFSLSGKTFDVSKIQKARNDLTDLLDDNELVPVRSYRVNLKVRKVRKGKLELFYEEELEREELGPGRDKKRARRNNANTDEA